MITYVAMFCVVTYMPRFILNSPIFLLVTRRGTMSAVAALSQIGLSMFDHRDVLDEEPRLGSQWRNLRLLLVLRFQELFF